MPVTYICGHIHPDTDSVASALALEEFYNRQGEPVIAVRGGELNPETAWVLKRFNTSSPPEIRDVRTQIRDVDYDHPQQLQQTEPLARAWQVMQESDTKSIPVVDEHNRLCGVITSGNVAAADLGYKLGEPLSLILKNLQEALQATVYGKRFEVVTGPLEIHGVGTEPSLGAIVFSSHFSVDLIEQCIQQKVPCLIECSQHPSSKEQLKAWDERYRQHIALLQTEADLYTAVRRAQVSAPVSTAMTTEKLVTFREEDYLDDVKERMLSTRYRSYPVLDSDGKVQGMISRYHLLRPNRKKVILVDHNERSQSVRGLEQAELLAIIDHHRLGDIQTDLPIYVRNEIVGCTSTIIANMFFEKHIEPSPRAAGLMLCAILSDTVEFKSPTCTPRDVDTAAYLAKIAGVEIPDLAQEMFSLSKQLHGHSTRDILFLDFKEFFFGDIKIGVSQISAMDFRGLENKLAEMPSVLADARDQWRSDIMLFMATDIQEEGTELYYACTQDNLRDLSQAFDQELTELEGSFFLPGVMSRKKQVIPAIGNALR